MAVLGVMVLLLACLIASVQSQSCGMSSHTDDHFQVLAGRIVGGIDAKPHEWPWQVSLQLVHPRTGRPQHFCGGVLINQKTVLTAGHCVKNHLSFFPNPGMYLVKLGKHNTRLTESNEQMVRIAQIVTYPWYYQYDNDISVLKLAEPVTLNEHVQPACLPPSGMDVTGMKCIATGWGKLDFEMAQTSDILKEVELDVHDNSVCDQAYKARYQISMRPWHLCAGTLSGGKGTCQGDSGGPFVCKHNGRYYIMGLTSFGAGCAKPGFPDVYTRVSYFSNWIQQQLS